MWLKCQTFMAVTSHVTISFKIVENILLSNYFLQAIKGSIVHGAMLSSSQVQEELEIPTMSGHSMTLYNSETGKGYSSQRRGI